jgi:hypothetical protein
MKYTIPMTRRQAEEVITRELEEMLERHEAPIRGVPLMRKYMDYTLAALPESKAWYDNFKQAHPTLFQSD